MTKTLLFLVLSAAAAMGQTVNLNAGACQGPAGGKPQVLIFTPMLLGTVTVSVPLCVSLGAGLAIDTTVTPPALIFTPAAVAPVVLPHMIVDRVKFPPATPASQTILAYTLAKTPAPGTMIIAVLRSSMIGENTVDIVPPNVGTPKDLTITLPLYRPFPDDGVLLQYWTLEP